MPRLPAPRIGIILSESFGFYLHEAIAMNEAVHDGAIMLGREFSEKEYYVTGWSFRLFPPPTLSAQEPNRGSAFNSCLAMSCVAKVDRLYLINRSATIRFEGGHFLCL